MYTTNYTVTVSMSKAVDIISLQPDIQVFTREPSIFMIYTPNTIV